MAQNRDEAKHEAFIQARQNVAAQGHKYNPDTDDEYDAIRDEMAGMAWEFDDEGRW